MLTTILLHTTYCIWKTQYYAICSPYNFSLLLFRKKCQKVVWGFLHLLEGDIFVSQM